MNPQLDVALDQQVQEYARLGAAYQKQFKLYKDAKEQVRLLTKETSTSTSEMVARTSINTPAGYTG